MSNSTSERLPPKRRRGDATILAEWPDGLRMMFGTSYRRWWDQLQEYCRINNLARPTIQVSREPWIGYGGLKWCSWDEFQNELNKEGAGRALSEFAFYLPNSIELNCLASIFRKGIK